MIQPLYTDIMHVVVIHTYYIHAPDLAYKYISIMRFKNKKVV